MAGGQIRATCERTTRIPMSCLFGGEGYRNCRLVDRISQEIETCWRNSSFMRPFSLEVSERVPCSIYREGTHPYMHSKRSFVGKCTSTYIALRAMLFWVSVRAFAARSTPRHLSRSYNVLPSSSPCTGYISLVISFSYTVVHSRF